MINKEIFGNINDRHIFKFTMINPQGMKACFINYGARIQSIIVTDVHGEPVDVVLGFETATEYVNDVSRQGAIVGRYAGKTQDASITLLGESYHLSNNKGTNEHPSHAHGGFDPFENKLWHVESYGSTDHSDFVEFSYLSVDGEEGYPGELKTVVRYSLDNSNFVHMDIVASSPTMAPVSLTNHSYFNMDGKGNVLDHVIQFNPKFMQGLDEKTGVATGEVIPLAKTPFGVINKAITVKKAMKESKSDGIDLGLMLNANGEFDAVGAIYSPKTGISMQVLSDAPLAIVYNGCNLNATCGKGMDHTKYAGFCIEPQGLQNSSNIPHFQTQMASLNNPWQMNVTFAFSVTRKYPF